MSNHTDLRVKKTQSALIEAFIFLISKKCFEDITVNELCDTAMIRRPTFYSHFADKYEFFAFFVNQIDSSKYIHTVNDLDITKSPYDYLEIFVTKSLDFFTEHERMMRNLLSSNTLLVVLDILSLRIFTNVKEFFEIYQEKGCQFTASTDILASLYTGAMVQVLRWWLKNQKSISKEEFFLEMHNAFAGFKIFSSISDASSDS